MIFDCSTAPDGIKDRLKSVQELVTTTTGYRCINLLLGMASRNSFFTAYYRRPYIKYFIWNMFLFEQTLLVVPSKSVRSAFNNYFLFPPSLQSCSSSLFSLGFATIHSALHSVVLNSHYPRKKNQFHQNLMKIWTFEKSIIYFSQNSYFSITKLKVAKWVKYWVLDHNMQKVELEKKNTEVLRHFKSYYDPRWDYQKFYNIGNSQASELKMYYFFSS